MIATTCTATDHCTCGATGCPSTHVVDTYIPRIHIIRVDPEIDRMIDEYFDSKPNKSKKVWSNVRQWTGKRRIK